MKGEIFFRLLVLCLYLLQFFLDLNFFIFDKVVTVIYRICKLLFFNFFGHVSRMFTNCPGDLCSIPGRVIPNFKNGT